MAGKAWGPSREEEDEYRRKLLLRARKGDLEAEHELMKKYGMRVYSDTERSKMPTYYDSGKKGSPPSLTSNPTEQQLRRRVYRHRQRQRRRRKPSRRPRWQRGKGRQSTVGLSLGDNGTTEPLLGRPFSIHSAIRITAPGPFRSEDFSK